MKPSIRTLLALAVSGVVTAGCASSPAPQTPVAQQQIKDESADAIHVMRQDFPDFAAFLDRADGYAIFPDVGKGAVGVGGAYGRGEVYEHGHMIGYAELSQATIGVQLGGQSYAEVICFETPFSLDRFQKGQLTFDASASAVALDSGAAATAKYNNGVAVFTQPNGGLMFEAAVGGQSFNYEPRGEAQADINYNANNNNNNSNNANNNYHAGAQ